MKQKDDYLWKGILENVFEDFLRLMHPDIDKLLDFGKGITFLDKELEQLYPPDDDDFAPRVVDKLAKVYTRTGEEQWILIHVEVQGIYKKDFPRRMFTYYSRLFDKYRQPIVAYGILTEPGMKIRSNCFNAGILGTNICYEFNLYKIALQKEEELLASDNPFAVVVLIAREAILNRQLTDKELMQKKIALLKRLIATRISKRKIQGIIAFLTHYVRFHNRENNAIFEEQKRLLTKNGNTMGIEELILHRERTLGKREGLKEGEAKGEIQKAISIALAMKADGQTLQAIKKYTGLPLNKIKQL